MLKTLFKKQMAEFGSAWLQDRKTGKQRVGTSKVTHLILLAVLAVYLMSMFWMLGTEFGGPMLQADLDWLYFAFTGLMSLVLGVFCCLFTTYASLYLAKDNEMLLAMPIPPSKILISRLMGVYAMGLGYEMIVQIPMILVYQFRRGFTPGALGASLFMALVLGVVIMSLSCVLGYVVALISVRLKNKSYVTVFISLGFIGAYYYYYMKLLNYLQDLVGKTSELAAIIRSKGFPVYAYGMGAKGDLLYLGIFTGGALLVFGLIYLVLSRSYLRILMVKRGEKRKVYKERTLKRSSREKALLWKERKRFTSSANYMLNCGLGLVFMVLIAGALIVKREMILEIFRMTFAGGEAYLVLLLAAMIGMCASMTDISAPSVSLEGKTIWILQSMPVDGWQVLKAKLAFHIRLAMPAALLCSLTFAFILPLSVLERVMLVAAGGIFVWFHAAFGLVMGVRFANLQWTNEIVAIKQSMPVLFALFGGWALIIALGAAYLILDDWLSPLMYLGLCELLLVGITVGMMVWLKKWGSLLFAKL